MGFDGEATVDVTGCGDVERAVLLVDAATAFPHATGAGVAERGADGADVGAAGHDADEFAEGGAGDTGVGVEPPEEVGGTELAGKTLAGEDVAHPEVKAA